MGGNSSNNNNNNNSAFESIRRANSSLIPAAARSGDGDDNGYPFQSYLQMNGVDDTTSQVAVLKMHSSIRRDTIKLVKDEEGKYYFSLQFDSIYNCAITFYLCSQELKNDKNIPLHFVTAPDLPSPSQYKFEAGTGQDFPPKLCMFNPSDYNQDSLTEAKDDYYPIVLVIETNYPKDYKGKAKNSSQIVYGSFKLLGSEYSFHCIKTKFLFNKRMFDIGEIFGVEGGTSNIVNDNNKLCVICFTNDKDTVVLPCRHMCLCMECSQIVRRQSNNCPICRTKVSTFIQIKDKKSKEDERNKESISDAKKDEVAEKAANDVMKDDNEEEMRGDEPEESKDSHKTNTYDLDV